MSLGSLIFADGKYTSRYEFLGDMKLIHTNASKFNGPDHSVTKRALYVLDFTKALMKEFDKTLTILEANIRKSSAESHDEEEEGEAEDEDEGGNEPVGRISTPTMEGRHHSSREW
jgi:hypothetical protein